MTKQKSHYGLCFILGFCLILFVILPDVIQNHGIFYFMGDINQQGLPFIYHLHENIRNGNFFWDWYAGLGINQIGAYTYYNLFSPFFLITLPFPAKWLVYMMPGLMALKFGTGAVTSYAYLKRHVKNDLFAVAGALIYTYSTFTAYNLVFQFLDVIVLFPLLLLAMDGLTDRNQRGFFAITVALMAMLNYYFFLGQVIFCIIYFLVKSICQKKLTLKLFISVAIEAVIGVLIAAIALLPTAEILLGSSRLSPDISFSNLFLYDTGLYRYGKIIQSMFILPDYFTYTNFFFDFTKFYPYGGVGSSVALYIPLFSMVGVISYVKARKKDWRSILLIICLIIAFVPVLNNMFSALSANYYARWFYMPLLIMSMVTMKSIEEEFSMKVGIIVEATAIVALSIWLACNDLLEIHRWEKINFQTDRFYAWASIVIAAVSLGLVIIIIKSKRDKEFTAKVLAFCILGIFCSSGFMTYYGLATHGNKPILISKDMLNTEDSYELEDKNFFRVYMDKSVRNSGSMHNLYSIDTFNSLYEPSVNEFYNFTGIVEDSIIRMESSPQYPEDVLQFAALFSAEYYFGFPDWPYVWPDELYDSLFPQSHFVSKQNDYYIYQNENYIPMGFTYDYYATKEQIEQAAEPKMRTFLMLKAIILEENDLLPQIPNELLTDTSYETMAKDCEDRNKVTSTCQIINDGIKSEITLPEENYVFYTIPYNKGFTAYDENGAKLEILRANIGFSAVKLPAGTHTVTFRYRPVTWNIAVACSLSGIALLAAYWIITKKKKI